jgi:adenylate cyclase
MRPWAGSWRRRWPGVLAASVVALGFAALIVGFSDATQPLRERLFDMMIGARAEPPSGRVWVVEIGVANEDGTPWGRGDLARLITTLAALKPAVIGLDIVLSQSCEPSARNSALTKAISQGPVVTGFLVPGPMGISQAAEAPLAVMEDAPAWDAKGAEAACGVFQTAATGTALVSLPGGPDGRVRVAPAAVFVAGKPFPGMAVELARRGQNWPPAILGKGDPGWLRLGEQTIPLDALGQFRFVPTPPADRAAQTIAADKVLAGDLFAIPQDAVILIGSALPESGGLRPSRASPLHPSVHLQADAVEGLMAGRSFARIGAAPSIEAGVVLVAGLAVVLLALALQPLGAAFAAVGVALGWVAFAFGSAVWGDRLYDPLLPGMGILGAAAAALLVEAAASRRAERNLSARMRQHLPGAVVDRVTDGSAPLHLAGEMREITALFTDIEGFSDLTRQMSPQALVALLDDYFTGITRIIADHGGMVDKIVGDAVHAFFNAPVDQPDHVDKAISAARAIRDFAADFTARVQAISFGRTRIGVETGQALLGDVGHGGRIDYTAHGDVVNMAARLQEASKTLGITVLIGPRASAQTSLPVTAAGEVELRSFGRVQVSTLPVSSGS